MHAVHSPHTVYSLRMRNNLEGRGEGALIRIIPEKVAWRHATLPCCGENPALLSFPHSITVNTLKELSQTCQLSRIARETHAFGHQLTLTRKEQKITRTT